VCHVIHGRTQSPRVAKRISEVTGHALDELWPGVYGDENDSIAARLRAFRTARGLTQSALASEAGIPLSTYKKYESGFRGSKPGGLAVAGLFNAGVNANWLLLGDAGGRMMRNGADRKMQPRSE
jgi:DNA-binding XRE family transcriptional regulator